MAVVAAALGDEHAWVAASPARTAATLLGVLALEARRCARARGSAGRPPSTARGSREAPRGEAAAKHCRAGREVAADVVAMSMDALVLGRCHVESAPSPRGALA